MAHYRLIWKHFYGEIPKDENGISYDIHHIDGNHKNNDISNLMAVSIREHYDIHYKQGDWLAAHYISQRLNLTKQEREAINRKISEIKTGVPLSEHHRKSICKPKTSTVNMRKPKSEAHKNKLRKPKPKVSCPHCNEVGPYNIFKHYHFDNCEKLTGRKAHRKEPIIKCPHCKKEGGHRAMRQWHFDNCKQNLSYWQPSSCKKL